MKRVNKLVVTANRHTELTCYVLMDRSKLDHIIRQPPNDVIATPDHRHVQLTIHYLKHQQHVTWIVLRLDEVVFAGIPDKCYCLSGVNVFLNFTDDYSQLIKRHSRVKQSSDVVISVHPRKVRHFWAIIMFYSKRWPLVIVIASQPSAIRAIEILLCVSIV